ncbi:DnaB-like helicase C-terminal domain-containing protein [Aurantimonas sp. 22II-16-19i]|uniref:replicative DNA helicase n=1 Tax=Aurantimonas sp. 22II-16-19i TaxID=1317114 RepID=UPI0009F7A8F1|nr:DnaB-like helicase C-terminal domain-containing protein [Aurantimonas sp. 22II-16-19i]ORE87718.1 replicative DNA helicase [Aurantimonas sp. 22II-16-19i]
MTMMQDRSFVPEVEQQLLGALLTGRGLPAVRSFLREEHFIEDIHSAIYEAICQAFDQSGATHAPVVGPLIPPRVDDALKNGLGITTSQYLASMLADTIHGGATITKAGRAVVEQWARINFARTLESSAAAAREPSSSIGTLLKSTGSMMEEMATAIRVAGSRQTRMTAGEAGDAALAAARRAMESKGALSGISWGLADVDKDTGGMQRRDLILMGARPSMGKTSAMTSIALSSARKGHGIGILSLEMDSAKLTARALSDLSLPTHQPIEYVDIIRGSLDEAQYLHVEKLNGQLKSLPIEIDESPVNTFDIRMKIEGMLERFEKRGWPRLECLMLDHLGFVQPGAAYRGNRNNEIGEITRALKDYAKEYDIAFLLLSQLSRLVTTRENKRPQLSDLRDSGNIEQDADVVIFLHREAYYLERCEETDADKDIARLDRLEQERHRLEFIIAKQRNGPVRTINLWCDMAYSAVRNGDRYRS